MNWYKYAQYQVYPKDPNMNIQDTNDRFKDYVGSSLQGIFNALYSQLQRKGIPTTQSKVDAFFNDFKRRIQVFKNNYNPTDKINEQSLNNLLQIANNIDYNEEGYEQLRTIYMDMVK